MEGILPTPFWTRVGWIPYELLLVGLLLLSLELAGYGEWITRRTLPLFLVWPAVTVLLVFTG